MWWRLNVALVWCWLLFVMCLQVGMLEKLAAGVVQVERRKAAFGRQRTPEFYLGMGGSSADHHVVS
jgi:hypothetical protein